MKRKNFTLITTVIVALLIFQSAAFAGKNTSGENKSSSRIEGLPKGVSVHVLNNGLEVLLIENRALPVVGFNAIIKVGSAYESFANSGASHMLEHLLFNGTTTRNQKQLYEDVDKIGGYNNATTEDFFTDFMFVSPVENVKKAFEIQVDMLFRSTLPDENFNKEKGIVLEEISKSIADPTEQIERNTISVLYKGHALSLPTLGTYATVEALKRNEINTFYKSNYVPNNIVLTVIGNFNSKEILAVINDVYGKITPAEVSRGQNNELVAGFDKVAGDGIKEGSVYHRFYDGKDTILQLFFKIPDEQKAEYYTLLSTLVNKGKESVQSALKAKYPGVKSLSFNVRDSHLNSYLEARVSISALPAYDSLAAEISREVVKIDFKYQDDFIKNEAVKARTEFLRNIEKPHMFGIYYSGLIVKEGAESIFRKYGDEAYFEAANQLSGLKLNKYDFTIIQFPQNKKEAGDQSGITATKLFADTVKGKSLVVIQNPNSNLLAVHYLIKHKASLEAKYGKDAAKILHDAFEQFLNTDETKKIAQKYGFIYTVNDNPFIPMDDIYLHPDFGYIRVEGLADDVTGAIAFLNKQFNEFVPTKEQFAKSVKKYKGIEAQLDNGDKARKLFEDEYKSRVYVDNFKGAEQPVLTYESLLKFAEEYFNPANFVISVVSPAPADTIHAAFDGLSYKKAVNRYPVLDNRIAATDSAITIEKKAGGERSYLFYGYIKNIDTADVAKLQVLSLLLNDYIVFDIREKQGLAYHMSAGVEVLGDKALFFINQGTRPKNVDTLVVQYPRLFAKAVRESLTKEKLEILVNQYTGKILFRKLSSINKAFYAGSSLYLHDNYNYDDNLLNSLHNVTVADIEAVAKKYLDIQKPISVIIR
jgi:predicted Zn-dependent peptidase